MVTMRRTGACLLLASLLLAGWAGAPARGDQPLSEDNLTKLIALQIDDEAIVDAMKLLAETEGIWTETAGGVTLAVAQKLIEQGRIGRDESIVVCITGNGLKTQEPLLERMQKPVVIKPSLEEFEALVEAHSPAFAGSVA